MTEYECIGCGKTLDGPPSEPPAFEVEISAYDCDTCEFVREDLLGDIEIR